MKLLYGRLPVVNLAQAYPFNYGLDRQRLPISFGKKTYGLNSI